jgi:hypothetical protein
MDLRKDKLDDIDDDEEREGLVRGVDAREWLLSNVGCFDEGFECEEETYAEWDNDEVEDLRDVGTLVLFAAGQALAVAIVVVGLVIEEGNGEDNGGFKS